MRLKGRAELIFWILTLSARPAWANNPPQPDGLFSLILIFPVVILGFRLAGAIYTEGERKWRVLRGSLLALAVILALAGTAMALIPLAILLAFGCVRGAQIMVRGTGPWRMLIGPAVCLWTLFAVSDYVVSLTVHSPVRFNETTVVEHLRSLNDAERAYALRDDSRRYATIEQLREARIPLQLTWGEPRDDPGAYDILFGSRNRSGYRYYSTVDPSGRRYWIVAVPVSYGKEVRPLVLPGSSWFHTLNHDLGGSGQRSFALDESGVIRAADLGTSRPVTREEAEKWKPLQ
jgi:hypothetical protein